ncbi:MAG: 16S rRNA (guanine(527)-N(7))-methyltransferase RsmG [Planctomycetota bacterium]|jgi:16S rRNA (guanine527-N7)-methyltransferase
MHQAEQFDRALEQALARWGISLLPDQLGQFRFHFEELVKANRVVNLTRITDPVEVAVKHCADSLALIQWAEKTQVDVKALLDLGTGAGFPAVPLAIMRPDWEITALDATQKKIAFLARTTEAMGLSNLHAVHAHSNHWQPRRAFQVVVLRAVAKLAVSLRRAHPLVSQGGWLVAYKTASLSAEELHAEREVATQLHYHDCQRFLYDLDCAGQTIRRALHVYERQT